MEELARRQLATNAPVRGIPDNARKQLPADPTQRATLERLVALERAVLRHLQEAFYYPLAESIQ